MKLAWTQRAELDARLTASLRKRLADDMERVHVIGAKQAVVAFLAHEPDAALDERLRWSLADILGEENAF
jgi:hypothetical protein